MLLPRRPLSHPAVAALAAICARVFGLCSAVLLRNAPATAREFNAFRTALDLTLALRLKLAFRPGLSVALRFALNVAARPAARFGCPGPPRGGWPRKLGRDADRDIAGLPPMRAPPKRIPPPARAPPPKCLPPPKCPPPPK